MFGWFRREDRETKAMRDEARKQLEEAVALSLKTIRNAHELISLTELFTANFSAKIGKPRRNDAI